MPVVVQGRAARRPEPRGEVVIGDLREVLTRISVRSGANGPQGPVTQYLLARAAEHLSAQLTGDALGRADREPVPRVLSALLGHEPFVENVLGMSAHQMRRRWPLATDWYADVVSYVLRPNRWTANHVAVLSEFETWLTRPAGEFLKLLGQHQLQACRAAELFRLGDVLSDLWPDYPPVMRARAVEHSWRLRRWMPVYAIVLEHYGLRVRSGADFEVVAWAVAALITMEPFPAQAPRPARPRHP